VVLTADLSEGPARWTEVASIPLGDAATELRYEPAHEIPAAEPTAFGVASDGSLWFVDPANHRLAHFTGTGRFLEEIRGTYNRVSRDLVFAGGRMLVLSKYHVGEIEQFRGRDRAGGASVHDTGGTVYVTDLVPTPSGLFAQVSGLTTPPATGPIGLYGVDVPGSGAIRTAPGLPLGPDRWVGLDADGSVDLAFRFVESGRQTVLPFHVDVRTKRDGRRVALDAVVGAGNFVVSGGDLYLYVRISASIPGEGGEQVGGRYLLRVGESPLLWERLPDPTVDDVEQFRHLTLGPDGRLYLMVTDRGAVRILRR
jgi:hypothetical protein